LQPSLFLLLSLLLQLSLLLLPSLPSTMAQSPPPSLPQPPRPTLLTSLSQVLIADLDETKFHFLHPRRIPWMQSPLNDEAQHGSELASDDEAKEAYFVVQTAENGHGNRKNNGHNHHHHHPFQSNKFEIGRDEPRLRYETKTSTIQLFYDLFFVANLTTFTAKHEISDGPSMSPRPSQHLH
jgi:hypothetical protein